MPERYGMTMKKSICTAAVAFCLIFTLSACHTADPPAPPYLIAHAGGEIDGLTYTNCQEALDLSYENGLRYFELDFSFTTDGHLICVHSYDGFMEKFFDAPRAACSYEQWQGFSMLNDYTKLDMESAVAWFNAHKDAYLITDVKGDNLVALGKLAQYAPTLKERIIPQIYDFAQYDAVCAMGYEKIILTLYRLDCPDEQVVTFAQEHELFGVTMHLPKGETGLPAALLPTRSFVHTVNDKAEIQKYIDTGVFGFYTDSLYSLDTVSR